MKLVFSVSAKLMEGFKTYGDYGEFTRNILTLNIIKCKQLLKMKAK